MRETYKLLKKLIYVFLGSLIITAAFGVLSFMYIYDATTNSLRFPHVITIMFYLFVLASIAVGVIISLKAKNKVLTRIRKTFHAMRFSSVLAAAVTLIFFVYESIITITQATFNGYFFCRVTRWILTLLLCSYFVIQAIPNKFHRRKISIHPVIKIIASIGSILWGIFGVFTTYFSGLAATDITKITQVLVYAAITLFLLFEGEFELIAPNNRPYMISAFTCASLCFAFPLPISIAKIANPEYSREAFSQPELLICFVIGLYAMAKMFAYVYTMRTVIDNRDSTFHSKKFDKEPAEAAKATPSTNEQ